MLPEHSADGRSSDPTLAPASSPQAPPSKDDVSQLVQLFKLLSDETRLRILAILHQAEQLNVLELCKLLNQRQPSVSHHLAVLRVAGLIGMRREGKHNFYHIRPTQFEKYARLVFEYASADSMRIRFNSHELSFSSLDS